MPTDQNWANSGLKITIKLQEGKHTKTLLDVLIANLYHCGTAADTNISS